MGRWGGSGCPLSRGAVEEEEWEEKERERRGMEEEKVMQRRGEEEKRCEKIGEGLGRCDERGGREEEVQMKKNSGWTGESRIQTV